MNRRDLIRTGLAIGGAAALSGFRLGQAATTKLNAPASGPVPVAFLISDGATMIDFTGPWEVFQDVNVPGREEPFQLYTVSASEKPIRTSGGMKVMPEYSFAKAPAPKVIVIPAQGDHSAPVLEWVRKSAASADVVMSVCTGAFLLAKTGLLDGASATTHHAFYRAFERTFPKVTLKRGARFVEGPKMATAGGLTSGVDLALRVVERYYGRPVVERTAFYMEYQSKGWLDSSGSANAEYLTALPPADPRNAIDPNCGMEIAKGELKAEYKKKTYYFCSENCKKSFLADPSE